jgi:hypothetical protein
VPLWVKNESSQMRIWVSASKFLGFIIHKNDIEIDPKKIEVIQKIQAPTCKRDVQKFIGKVNFL